MMVCLLDPGTIQWRAFGCRFNDEIQKPLKEHRVWSACKSWYNKQGERNFALWPHTVTSYWWRTRSPKWSDLVFGQ
jgi:hypothetical protein